MDKCPRCGSELKCLAGHSAHPLNWYCKNENICGWQAWNHNSLWEKSMNDEVEVGAFVASLKRNNKQIRDDRASAITEDAQMAYKRSVEDLEMGIKRMRREQENMLDLSPDNAQSLILGKDFDSATYISRDAELGLNIRNAEIKLDIAATRYLYLFGDI